ncbi:alginate lyase family protein [Dyella japonica]|uniref:alginate lyase family protein n=1 Tax=Dyella japonica TaxID=231455 RepID=UPI0012FD31F1|nr:alginate lyase family protein [Dyella japonica]
MITAVTMMLAGCASDAVHPGGSSTPEATPASLGSAGWPEVGDMEAWRATPARWQSLRTTCDRHIGYEPHPVSDFSPPPHYVDREGEQRIVKPFTDDGDVAYREALCFAASGDRRYAEVAERILDAWAAGVQRIGQGQGVADVNFMFPRYALAATMVRADSQWNDAKFRAFVRQRVLPLSTASRNNNFGNWGVFLEASSAAYLQDRGLMQRAAKRWQSLMLSQVAQDGSMPAEICRSNTSDYCGGADKGVNGLSYTHYTLFPTTMAAEIFRNAGIDVYAGNAGHQLSLAYARAAQWTLHPETFPYYASNNGHLNGVRNAAYFRILQRRMPNDDGRAVIAQGHLGMDGFEIESLYAQP